MSEEVEQSTSSQQSK